MRERVRFAPSPSGGLHLGGARTALANWLLARQSGGDFVIRIEDTHAAESVAESERTILGDIVWLGLDWDEGPDIGGPVGPYRQSERTGRHIEAFEALKAKGAVYPCFCTPEELLTERVVAEEGGCPPRYSGQCRELGPAEASRRIAAGESHSWRFAVTRDAVEIHDLVHGSVSFPTDRVGDFVVRRSDGTFTFDLASVTDDSDMGITTVMRGDDHLPNTPRHLMLYHALGSPVPRFAHLPLVTDASGRPLSKSSGAESVAALRVSGVPASAVVHHLALLGWSPPNAYEVLDLEYLVEHYDLSRVSRAPARHDPAHLRHLSALHLRSLPPERLAEEMEPWFTGIPPWLDRVALARAISSEVVVLEDAAEVARDLVGPDPDSDAAEALAAPGASEVLVAAEGALAACEDPVEAGSAIREALRGSGVSPAVGMPAIRAALIGRAHGLPVDVIVELLGRDRAAERLRRETLLRR